VLGVDGLGHRVSPRGRRARAQGPVRKARRGNSNGDGGGGEPGGRMERVGADVVDDPHWVGLCGEMGTAEG